jgi:hypothetical protein
MDIHKPKPVRHWRAFLGEVGIIVLGVLIALAAEQTVQALDWSAKARRAEAAMRLELTQDDGPQAHGRVAVERCLRERLAAIRGAVEQGASRADVLKLTDGYPAPRFTWDQLAYQAAVASDIATHLPVERMAHWTQAYVDVPALDRTNEKEFNDGAELRSLSRTGGPLSAAERDRLIHAAEMLNRDDQAMVELMNGLIEGMDTLGLKVPPARMRDELAGAGGDYGGCTVRPSDTIVGSKARSGGRAR